ncbi:MAG: hypothetical protein EHM48_04980, partial [Planctomycetaceae bacterium]
MSNKRKNRGSILIMVVGMLTVLFMLGLTFLAVCQMNAKQAEATAATSQVEPISDGLVARIRTTLRDGRYINQTNGPYGSLGGGGATNWQNYIVYPDSNVTKWLSSSDPDNTYTSKEFVTPSDSYMVDTNGDGTPDAYLSDTGVTNNNGDKFYAAVRIEDLSGRFNVNVAGDGTTITPVNYPSAVNLSNYIGAPYGNLAGANGRYPLNANINDYSLNCARRLFAPNNPPSPNPVSYRPFGIGDEAFLRWKKSAPNMTTSGRLYSIIGTANRDNLTTINCSSGIPRSPSKDFPTKTYVKGFVSTTDASTALDTEEARQRLYIQLKDAWGDNNDAQKKRAHFVANLWAYLDKLTDPATGKFTVNFKPKAYKFKPSGEDWQVYGVIDQPIISEVFAYYLPEYESSPDPTNDQGWAVAVEIFNPTAHEIPMHDAVGNPLYRIKCGNRTPDSSNYYSLNLDTNGTKLTLPPGGRIVVYTLGGQCGAKNNMTRKKRDPADEDHFDFAKTDPQRWLKTPVLEAFGSSADVKLYRSVESEEILMDSVSAKDINFDSVAN